MTEEFDHMVEALLENLVNEGYAVLHRPPSQIAVVPGSDAEKILRKNPKGKYDPADGLRTAIRDWDGYKTQRIFEKDHY